MKLLQVFLLHLHCTSPSLIPTNQPHGILSHRIICAYYQPHTKSQSHCHCISFMVHVMPTLRLTVTPRDHSDAYTHLVLSGTALRLGVLIKTVYRNSHGRVRGGNQCDQRIFTGPASLRRGAEKDSAVADNR
jgi:hypothetical protein